MSNTPPFIFDIPEWFDRTCADSTLLAFRRDLRSFGMYSMAGTLGGLDALGRIPESAVRIFEFGSGMGEGLVTLDMFVRYRGKGTIKGSEIDPYKRRIAKQVAVSIDCVESVESDGIVSLAEADQPFDVVLANMFGPSYHDQMLPSKFIPAALDVLAPNGVIIINSDPLTMDNVNSWAQNNLDPSQIESFESGVVIPVDLNILKPHTLIMGL